MLIHELPWRLRFRLVWLHHPHLDHTLVRAHVENVQGVAAVRINYDAASIVVEYDGSGQSRKAIMETLDRLDPARLLGSERSAPARRTDRLGLLGRSLAILLLPLLPRPGQRALAYVTIADTVLIGLNTLINRGIKVEVLDAVALGLSAAQGQYLTVSFVHWLLRLGEFMEDETARRSEALIAGLLKQRAGAAWVERGGTLVQVDPREIREGEVTVAGPGDTIPVDGILLAGTGLINQASITGESLPVRREPGDRVLAGTIVEDGNLKILAEGVGDESTTAKINRFILEALQQRSYTQRISSEMADRRVLVTFGIGALVLACTGDFTRLSSVFMVDYSCALKLSTPVSFKAGMYQAARAGVLLKGSKAIEDLAEIDTVVFDKTGTLSHGDLRVTDVISLQPERYDEQQLLAVAASVEEHSKHPVATAVVQAARRRNLGHIHHGEVEHIVAHGLRSSMGEDSFTIGSRHFLESHELIDVGAHRDRIDALEAAGKMLLYLAQGKDLVGILALEDRLRDEAIEVLRRLREGGVANLVLLTGDRWPKARGLARRLRMDEVYAEMAPEDKAEMVKALQRQGRRVAFVGDGVNDAPALATADVGISMPRGADITRHMADVVLLKDDLGGVAAARELAAGTMRLIRSNMILAEGVNSAIMLGAALGWLPPTATALLHNGATIGILLRAMASQGPGVSAVASDRAEA